jgi:dienelactone hydrolase
VARSDLPTRSDEWALMGGSEALTPGPADRREAHSVAFWLGGPDRPLFCFLDLPDDGVVSGAAVVCPTMGLEGEYSGRALRDLAQRLAGNGWACLRLAYAGTGDSVGTWSDSALVAEWLESIRAAVAYVRSLGAPRVGVVGLRIGATLAAAALAPAGGVDDIVLWDPCPTGKAFLREQRAFQALLRHRDIEWGLLKEGEAWGSGDEDEGEVEATQAPGIVFSAETVSALEQVTVGPSDRALASRELVVARQGRKLNRLLEGRLSLDNVETVRVEGQEALLDVAAVTPEPALDRIVAWLMESGTPAVPLEIPPRYATEARVHDGPNAVVERPVALGTFGLFGVLSEPAVGADPSAPTMVMLNAGRISHHGPGRLWVEQSRSWAAAGVRCLRVDLSGIGDSPTRPGRTELVEYPADGSEDLCDIRHAVGDAWGPKIVFVGLCSGGHYAVEAALAGPTLAVCLINPALEYRRWGDHAYRTFEPDDGTTESGDGAGLGSVRPWLSRYMTQLGPLRRASSQLPNSGWWVVKRLLMTKSAGRTLEQLARAGIDALLVADEGEAQKLSRGEGGRFRNLEATGRLRMETIPNLEHSLFERTGRERVAELLDAYVVNLLGGRSNNGARS